MLHFMKIGDTLVFSRRRPQRPVFLRVAQNYSVLSGLIVTAIIWISVLPYAPGWVGLWLVLYWFYKIFRPLIFTINTSDPSSFSFPRQLLRCIIITSFASLLIAHIYLYTDYLKDNGFSNTIWLIYILPIFITIQYGDHKLMQISVALSFLSLIGISVAASLTLFRQLMPDLIVNTIVDLLWLFLISFMLYVLVRFINDRSADLRLLHDLGRELIGISAADDEPELFQTIVTKIATHFPYTHIFIFLLRKDDLLECVAGSSPEGRRLAEQKFTLSSNDNDSVGIVRHVVDTGALYYSNDVRKDKLHRSHPMFEDTRSELAVPIRINGNIVGVLDIQDRRWGAFLAQDTEIMEILADHIGRVLDNVTSLQEIVRSVARRFMSHHELNTTLEDIARAAHEELKSDIVLVYEHNPLTNQTSLGGYFGEINDDERFKGMVSSMCPVVERLLAAKNDYHFQENVHEEATAPLLRWARIHTRSYELLDREKIVSVATLRFKADTNNVGMMFLAFRTPRRFDEREKRKFYIFADLAALAIQKAQVQQQLIQHEREDLAWHLHDEIMAIAFGISKLISASLKDQTLAEHHRARLQMVQEAIRELTKNTKNLHEAWKDISPVDIYSEVETIIEKATKTHGVTFNTTFHERPRFVSPRLAYQLKMILNEAITNAIGHGHATAIDLGFEAVNNELEMFLNDNGIGFDMEAIIERGIANMRERARRLGGKFHIQSAAGGGTQISVKMPM